MSAKLSQTLKESLSSSQIIATPHIENKEETLYLPRSLAERREINWVEITLRTPIALDIIRIMTKEFPEMNVMAGTVIEPYQVAEVQDSGAKVAVSPNLSIHVLEEASSKSIIICTFGVATPSEIGLGIELGLDTFKFFSAEMIGGMRLKKRNGIPTHKKVQFIPLGGLSEKLITEYTSEDFVLALGGSWITKKELIKAKDWEQITKNAVNAREKIAQ